MAEMKGLSGRDARTLVEAFRCLLYDEGIEMVEVKELLEKFGFSPEQIRLVDDLLAPAPVNGETNE